MSFSRAAIVATLALVIACAPVAPVVTCDETEFTPPSPLECDAAIGAATAALGDDHPEIAHVTFQYGMHCPPGWECPMTSSEQGVVHFDFAWFAEGVYVEVTAEAGTVVIRSGPTPGSP